MNGLRAAKYGVKALYVVVSVVIALVICGPIAGFLTPHLPQHNVVGFGVDIEQVGPQLQSIFSGGSSLTASHQIIVPVHNIWVFPATAELSLKLIVDGTVVYQTPVSSLRLQPFQTGELNLTLQLNQSTANQIQGKRIIVGGDLTLGSPAYMWTLTVHFP